MNSFDIWLEKQTEESLFKAFDERRRRKGGTGRNHQRNSPMAIKVMTNRKRQHPVTPKE